MNNSPVVNFKNKILSVIKHMDELDPEINLSGLGTRLPTVYDTWMFWFKPTDTLIKKIGTERFIFQTFDVFLYDNVGDADTLAALTLAITDFESFGSQFDFTVHSEEAYELVTGKGYVKRSLVLKTNLVANTLEDDCCNIVKIEGADGNGSGGASGALRVQLTSDMISGSSNVITLTDFSDFPDDDVALIVLPSGFYNSGYIYDGTTIEFTSSQTVAPGDWVSIFFGKLVTTTTPTTNNLVLVLTGGDTLVLVSSGGDNLVLQ